MDTAFTNSGPMRPAGAIALGADRPTRNAASRTRTTAPCTRTDAASRTRTAAPRNHDAGSRDHDAAAYGPIPAPHPDAGADGCPDAALGTRLRRGGQGAFRAIRAFGGAAFSVVVLGSGTETTSPSHHTAL